MWHMCVREGGRCVAGMWQVCGRCVAVGRFCVAVVPRLCGSLCGRCVVSAWQLVVGRQVCLTIGPVKIMVEKPANTNLRILADSMAVWDRSNSI